MASDDKLAQVSTADVQRQLNELRRRVDKVSDDLWARSSACPYPEWKQAMKAAAQVLRNIVRMR